jgi:hypothetical protein
MKGTLYISPVIAGWSGFVAKFGTEEWIHAANVDPNPTPNPLLRCRAAEMDMGTVSMVAR